MISRARRISRGTLRQGEFRDNSSGADLDFSIRGDGIHPLHYLAVYAPGEAMKLARLLLAAGRDIDPECDIGTTPLCWCLTAGQLTKAHYQLATFLIENGCDVHKAHRGWNRALDVHGARGQRGPMLLDILCQQPRTTTNLRFTQYFGEKLVLAEIIASAARFPPPGTSAVDSCRPM